MQNFWADSDYLGKINNNLFFFKNFFFQCLALPKDPQSFCCYVVKAQKMSSEFFKTKMSYSNSARISKIQLDVGGIVIDFFFHPLGDHKVMEFLCILSTKSVFVMAIAPTSK